MRILFLNYEYPPLGGGAGNASFYILQEFAKIPGLEVDFITSSTDKFELEKIGDNIRIHRLDIGKNGKNIHLQSRKDLLTYSWKSYFYARKLIRQLAKKNSRYDLTHSFFTIPCGFISLLLKWQYRIPYIISLRGSDVPGYSDRFPIIYKFIKPLVRLIWKSSSAVIANSQGLKDLALKTMPGEIGIIYNGIDIEQFKPQKKEPHDKFIIINTSRLTPRKGIKYLILAAKQLTKRDKKLKIILAGEGNEKRDLEILTEKLGIAESIQFTGSVNHDKISEFYNQADVFVLTSLNEGMSNAMLEALASGLPIITTLTGGAQELVQEGVNGFFIKTKDSKDLAKKMERILSNPELCEKMGEESRKIAEKMSWKNVAEKYFEEYKNINEKK